MLNYERLFADAAECGFTHWGRLDVSTLEFMDEVRAMCSADRCRSYGKSWSCPPGCGTIEDARGRAARFSEGILVQTVGELEDEFDWEGMMDTEALHKAHFEKMHAILQAQYPDFFPMAEGVCKLCETCTYPDAPCRFPEKMCPSMEACGLFVARVCEKNGMAYNHGKNTVCYTSCFLLG